MLQRLFYTSFKENVILTTAARFKTQKQKTSYSRKTRWNIPKTIHYKRPSNCLLFGTISVFIISLVWEERKEVGHSAYHKSYLSLKTNLMSQDKPHESRVHLPENFQRVKQSSNCALEVYSSGLLFYTYSRIRKSKSTGLITVTYLHKCSQNLMWIGWTFPVKN